MSEVPAEWLSMPAESFVILTSPVTVPREGHEHSTGDFIRRVFFANLPLPFQKIRTYLWLVFFSRALGPSGFGIWSLFQTTLGLGLILTSMTQGNAMMRFLAGKHTRHEINRGLSSVFAAVSISSLILALGFVVFSKDLSRLLFRGDGGRTLLLLIALILPLETYFEEMRGFLRARRLNRSWAFFTLGRQVPETLLLVALVWWWMRDPVALVGGYLVTAALSVSLGFFYLVRYQRIGLARPSAVMMSKYVPYGLALVPGALASTLSFSADRYLVGYYLDLHQVGIYSVCFTVSSLGFFFVGPLNDVLFPEMAALHDAGDRNEFYARFSGVQKVVTGLSVGSTALLIAFPREILRVLTTQDFSSGGLTLVILGLQGIFMSVVMLYNVILLVQLRVWCTTAVWAGMGAMVLLVDVVLLPRVGIVGAGSSQLISSVAGALLAVGLNWEIFRSTFRFVWILQTGAALLGVWLLAHSWQSSAASIGQSLEHIAVGAAVFVLGLFVTRYLCLGELVALQKAMSGSGA
jgi:O-antigen/teichoic acid export membrane protein